MRICKVDATTSFTSSKSDDCVLSFLRLTIHLIHVWIAISTGYHNHHTIISNAIVMFITGSNTKDIKLLFSSQNHALLKADIE